MCSKRVLFCTAGRSGAGKDTLVRAAEKEFGFKSVCSFTDRPIREGEVDGREHYFVSKEEMTEILATQHILAKTEINGCRYCATVESLGDDVKFYIIDPEGIEYLRKNSDELGILPVVIYISTSNELRGMRVEKRGDARTTYKDRFSSEDEQFSQFEKSTYFLSGYLQDDSGIWEFLNTTKRSTAFMVLNNCDVEYASVFFSKIVKCVLEHYNQ